MTHTVLGITRLPKSSQKDFVPPATLVFEELRVPSKNSFMKPDLIGVKNGVATVMDANIVGDCWAATAWLDKKGEIWN